MAMKDKEQQQVFDQLERLAKTNAKRYVKVSEAQNMFSMGYEKIHKLGEAAGATRRIDGVVLYNVKILYDYIEEMYS